MTPLNHDTADKARHPRYLRRAEAAQYLQEEWGLPTAARTLAKLACVSSEGPRSTSEAGRGRTAPTEKARTKALALAGDQPRPPAKIELLR